MPGDDALGVMADARARVLHDLNVDGADVAATVSVVEDAVVARGQWLAAWAEGAPFVAGLVAQDVQEALEEGAASVHLRWPACRDCPDPAEHSLRIEPELGENPCWVCERSGIVVAPLGELAARTR